MADITLGTVRDYWKRVSDWLQGNVADKPSVTVYGSDDGGTTKRLVKTGSDGTVQASTKITDDTGANVWAVDGDGNGPVTLNGSITPTHTAVNITSTSGEVLAANANRKYALLINDSDTVIYLKIGSPAVVNEGIRLNANGSSYEMAAALGNLATGAINGIHGSSGSKVLTVLEGV